MVRTRASRRDSPATEPPLRAKPPRARPAREKAAADDTSGESTRSSPVREPRTSPSALAVRYGAPARRSAPIPDSSFSLSQVTAKSSQDSALLIPRARTDEEEADPVSRAVAAVISSQRASVSAQSRRSRSSASRKSPATPKETQANSKEELDETIELRTACLHDLGQAAEKLFMQLFAETANRSIWKKIVELHRRAFQNLRTVYADPSEPLINIESVIDTINEDSKLQALQVLSQANMASFLDELTSTDDSAVLIDLLRLLDNSDFPLPFNPLSSKRSVSDEDVDQAIEIRTQRLIASLVQYKGLKKPPKPRNISRWVANMFCAQDANGNIKLDITEENMADICGFRNPLPTELAERCLARATEVLEHAQGNTVQEITESLRAVYPIEEWRTGLTQWGRDQFPKLSEVEADSEPEEEPGEDRVVSEDDDQESEVSQEIIRRPETTGALRFNKEMVAFIHGKAPVRKGKAPAAPLALNGDAYNESIARRAAARLGTSQSQSQTRAASSVHGSPHVKGRKHTRDQEEDEQDEADAFQQDTRVPDKERRRELDQRTIPPPASKRPRREPPSASAPPPPPQDDDDPFAEDDAPSPAPVDFNAIHERNRRPAQQEIHHQRIPWSNSDTKKLIDFIAAHHCGWAKIYETANPVGKQGHPPPPFNPDVHFANPRGQQAIRDKARNLKVDFLKADLILPMGFDGVILGKKERDTLIARSKNPYRLEADVDARGNPTNTYFIEE